MKLKHHDCHLLKNKIMSRKISKMSKKKKEEIIRFRLEFFDDMIKQIRCRIEDWISNSEYYY